jgi:hypothetical protein
MKGSGMHALLTADIEHRFSIKAGHQNAIKAVGGSSSKFTGCSPLPG